MTSQFILSLISGVFIGGLAGYLGSLMLSKRMALVAGPLGHLALPGIALALVYGFNVSIGAFPFVILGIVLIWLFEIRTNLPMEALTAIVFSLGVALAFLFLPLDKAESALIGDISKVNFLDTLITIALSLALMLVINRIYPKMMLINISEDLARAEGVNVEKYNFIYLGVIAIMVALGVKLVGGLLTAALVAIPACSARNISGNLKEYAMFSLSFGILTAILGLYLFKLTNFPAGPMIIITSASIFLITMIFKK